MSVDPSVCYWILGSFRKTAPAQPSATGLPCIRPCSSPLKKADIFWLKYWEWSYFNVCLWSVQYKHYISNLSRRLSLSLSTISLLFFLFTNRENQFSDEICLVVKTEGISLNQIFLSMFSVCRFVWFDWIFVSSQHFFLGFCDLTKYWPMPIPILMLAW